MEDCVEEESGLSFIGVLMGAAAEKRLQARQETRLSSSFRPACEVNFMTHLPYARVRPRKSKMRRGEVAPVFAVSVH